MSIEGLPNKALHQTNGPWHAEARSQVNAVLGGLVESRQNLP